MPKRYQPFLIEESQTTGVPDLQIRYTYDVLEVDHQVQVANLSDIIVWKDTKSDGSYQWVYQLRNGSASITVNADYSEIVVHCPRNLEYLFHCNFGEIFGSYFQIILECKLVQDGFVVLHSACVEKNGRAYAFTGNSGVGKSTRAAKWCELLSAELISGDRPAINVKEGKVYGVPWDGKEGVYRNVSYPLTAILIVNRSEKVKVKDLTESEKMKILSEQISVPMWDTALAAKSISSLRNLVRRIPVFDLLCGIDDLSTLRSYDLLTQKITV